MSAVTTVLTTQFYDGELLAQMRLRSPNARFVPLPENGDVPVDARDATVMLRCYMGKEEFSNCLSQAPALEWIHTCTAGFDQLLVPEIVERGLTVSRSASSHHIPIAEWAMATLLSVSKLLPRAAQAQNASQWLEPTQWPEPVEMFGGTMGIVGAGAIGAEVARRAKAFGMTVLGTKRTPTGVGAFFDEVLPPSGLDDMLSRSDFIVVACPLTPDTRGSIGTRQFELMKPTAYLCNVARGAILDEDALITALRTGQIAGAAIDAFVQEPLPPESELWNLGNVVVTPHASARSRMSIYRATEEFALNLERFRNKMPLHNVLSDPSLGY